MSAVSAHTIRTFLDLSSGHLPPPAPACPRLPPTRRGCPPQPGVIARSFPEGWWLWIPPDVDAHLDGHDPDEAIVAIWRLARSLDCDWALIDADGPLSPNLTLWAW